MTIFPGYLNEVSKEMSHQHERIRDDFISHKPSAGQNRESILAEFLSKHLPFSFGVDTGLINSHNGSFSNEADIVIYDKMWNTCLHPDLLKKIFLVESVYSLVEVKTRLNPSDIQDAVQKCRKFKTLPRKFSDHPIPRIDDSIFTLWAFESPEPQTVKKNLCSALKDIPPKESPDFIIVPGKFLITAGSYHHLVTLGQPNSPFQSGLGQTQYTAIRDKITKESLSFYYLRENSLFVWFFYMTSWLRHAGNRCPNILGYIPNDKILGRML